MNFQQMEDLMQENLNVLRHCPLFAGIESADLLQLLQCLGAHTDFYDKKYTIFAEGKPARFVGVVLSGSAQIQRTDYNGNRSILANVLPGELFAEAFACAGVEAMPVSVVANEPSVILLIDSERILRPCAGHCGFHQQLIYNLMQNLAVKSVQMQQKLQVLSCRTTREKLLTYLTQQTQKTGSSTVTVPFDRQALADFLEVDRSGLSAEISKLRKEGILACRKNQFVLRGRYPL